MVDYHVHIVGHGDSGSKCYIHDNVSEYPCMSMYPIRTTMTGTSVLVMSMILSYI